jgi:hypothetical protein
VVVQRSVYSIPAELIVKILLCGEGLGRLDTRTMTWCRIQKPCDSSGEEQCSPCLRPWGPPSSGVVCARGWGKHGSDRSVHGPV